MELKDRKDFPKTLYVKSRHYGPYNKKGFTCKDAITHEGTYATYKLVDVKTYKIKIVEQEAANKDKDNG